MTRVSRKTKRRTNRKKRRSIKRSIKRDLEKSLRKTIERSIKKSLNKFNKRIKKHKKKKTKKKKIQRGGAAQGDGGQEEEERVDLIIQTFRAIYSQQNKEFLDRLKKSLEEKTYFENPDTSGSMSRHANELETTVAFKIYKKTLSDIGDPDLLNLLYYANTIIMIIETLHYRVIPGNIKDLFIGLLDDEEFNQIYIPFILYIFATVYQNAPAAASPGVSGYDLFHRQNREVLGELLGTAQFIKYFNDLKADSTIADVLYILETKLNGLGNDLGGATDFVRRLLKVNNIFNIEELGQTAEAAGAVSQEPAGESQPTLEETRVRLAEMEERARAARAAILEEERGAKEEDCTIAERVAKLTIKLQECEDKQMQSNAALKVENEKVAEAERLQTEATVKVEETESKLKQSQEMIERLEIELAEARARLEQAEEAASARALFERDLMERVGYLEKELRDASVERKVLQGDLVDAQTALAVASAEYKSTLAQAADEGKKVDKSVRDGRLEIGNLNKQITRLLKGKACSTLAEIIIDLKFIEDEAAAGAVAVGAAAEVGLDGNKYGLGEGTSLTLIKIAVREIAKALDYDETVTELYEGIEGDEAEVNGVIERLLYHIYDGNNDLIETCKRKIELPQGAAVQQEPVVALQPPPEGLEEVQQPQPLAVEPQPPPIANPEENDGDSGTD